MTLPRGWSVLAALTITGASSAGGVWVVCQSVIATRKAATSAPPSAQRGRSQTRLATSAGAARRASSMPRTIPGQNPVQSGSAALAAGLRERWRRARVRRSPSASRRHAAPPGASAGVVICHPHPLYGGDMDNPVVVRVQEACAAEGLATLRFNFRGVGGSSGTHGEGGGEQDDARAALEALEQKAGTAALAIAGYSFGAWIAAVG